MTYGDETYGEETFAGDGAPPPPVTHFAAISFSIPGDLSLSATVTHFAAISFTAEADLELAEPHRIIGWAKIRFNARATLNLTIRPRGKKRRTIIVDSEGAPFGELENARHGAITKELNRPDEWTLALGIDDPKAELVLDQRIREAQLWRGDRIVSWGPMVRPGADKVNVGISGKDALWYLGRRNIGRAGRENYVPNGDFEEGLVGWSVGYSNPIEPLAGRKPSHWIGTIRTDRALTGVRSLYLEQKVTGQPKYGFNAGQFFVWEVDDEVSPDGDRWTLVAYAYVVGSKWRGPNHNSTGVKLGRWSTTEIVMIGAEDGSTPAIPYPAPIESSIAQIDEYTPHDQWVRLETSFTQPPGTEPELVGIGLYCPDGAVYWDRASLTLEESSKFYGVDQAIIAKELVEHAQDPAFEKSDLNIGTDTPLTGVLRDRIYLHQEHPNVLASVAEFSELDNGIDFSIAVTPTTRTFRTHYPARGVFRPKCALELGKTISDFAWSFDGEGAANAIIVLGQGSGSGREEGYAIDPDAFAGGLTLEAVFSAPPETPIDSLDNLAAEYAVAAGAPEILAVTTFPNLEHVIEVLEPGDTIPVRIARGPLNIADTYRVSRMTLTPDDRLELVLNRRELPE